MTTYKVTTGNLPSGLVREFSGIKEMNGQKQALRAVGLEMRRIAKKGIENSPKIGNEYFYQGLGWTRASLAGAYPANQTGNLQRSVGFRTRNSVSLKVGATAEYAKYLQQTSNPDEKPRAGGKIAERPFLTLAHNELKSRYEKIMANEMLGEIT